MLNAFDDSGMNHLQKFDPDAYKALPPLPLRTMDHLGLG